MKRFIKYLIGFGIAGAFFIGTSVAASVLQPFQGGTGFGSASSTSKGYCLQISTTTPYLGYVFAPCGSGGGLSTTTPFSAGYLPLVTSSLALTNSAIFQSGSNVGIGLTNPAYALDMAAGDVYGYNGTVMAQASTTLFNYFLGGAGTIGAAATGAKNTGTGYQALSNLTTGNSNTANGYRSLNSNTTGNSNTANGLIPSTTAPQAATTRRTAMLPSAATPGANNTANGYYSLYNNTTKIATLGAITAVRDILRERIREFR